MLWSFIFVQCALGNAYEVIFAALHVDAGVHAAYSQGNAEWGGRLGALDRNRNFFSCKTWMRYDE